MNTSITHPPRPEHLSLPYLQDEKQTVDEAPSPPERARNPVHRAAVAWKRSSELGGDESLRKTPRYTSDAKAKNRGECTGALHSHFYSEGTAGNAASQVTGHRGHGKQTCY